MLQHPRAHLRHAIFAQPGTPASSPPRGRSGGPHQPSHSRGPRSPFPHSPTRPPASAPQVAGLPTNIGFLQRLAAHPQFEALELDTGAPPCARTRIYGRPRAPPGAQRLRRGMHCAAAARRGPRSSLVAASLNPSTDLTLLFPALKPPDPTPSSHSIPPHHTTSFHPIMPHPCCPPPGFIERYKGELLAPQPVPPAIAALAAVARCKLQARARGVRGGGGAQGCSAQRRSTRMWRRPPAALAAAVSTCARVRTVPPRRPRAPRRRRWRASDRLLPPAPGASRTASACGCHMRSSWRWRRASAARGALRWSWG